MPALQTHPDGKDPRRAKVTWQRVRLSLASPFKKGDNPGASVSSRKLHDPQANWNRAQ